MIPNRERYAYRIGDVAEGSKEITIVTIGKADENWARVATLPNLVELTLHEPTQDQLAACGKLRGIQRLRITHARPKSILLKLLGIVAERGICFTGSSDITKKGLRQVSFRADLEIVERTG